MSRQLNDNSEMPFGKYKGKKMANVPAGYLLWLFQQDWISKWPRVKQYIDYNLDVLEAEGPSEYDWPEDHGGRAI